MAFGGVETGNTKAKLAAMQTPKVGGTGETFADWAIAITTGTSMLAAAVLETKMREGTLRNLQGFRGVSLYLIGWRGVGWGRIWVLAGTILGTVQSSVLQKDQSLACF